MDLDALLIFGILLATFVVCVRRSLQIGLALGVGQ